MARVIPNESTIYRVQFSARYYKFIECENERDLFEYLANAHGDVFTSVTEMCKDGSTPRVAVRSNPEFKQILRELREPPIVHVNEYYYINKNGCHYYLTPLEEKYKDEIGQFAIDERSLGKARSAAKDWAKKFDGQFKIKVEK